MITLKETWSHYYDQGCGGFAADAVGITVHSKDRHSSCGYEHVARRRLASLLVFGAG